jgi:molybdopterin molybdotransferase
MVNEFLRILEVPEFEEVLRELYDKFYTEYETEYVNLLDAHQRVLNEDIFATMDVPPFDRTTKDGFAVYCEDTFNASEENPTVLKLLEHIDAGYNPKKEVKSGFCSLINTGAPIPPGADGIVMVEYTKSYDDKIHIFKPCPPGQDIVRKGSDIKKGEILIKKGTLLSSDKIGALSALGLTKIPVRKLAEIGSELKPGEIYDINSYALQAAVSSCACEPIWLGVVPDDYESLKKVLIESLEKSDLILTSGSTSAGTGDVLKDVLDELGEVLVHGISVKPGKPTIVGTVNDKMVIGLPGNPVAALMIFEIFLSPLLCEFSNLNTDIITNTVEYPLEKRFYSSKGRQHYAMVKISEGKVYPIFKDSGAIVGLSQASGYITIPKNVEMITEGTIVKVHLFDKF